MRRHELTDDGPSLPRCCRTSRGAWLGWTTADPKPSSQLSSPPPLVSGSMRYERCYLENRVKTPNVLKGKWCPGEDYRGATTKSLILRNINAHFDVVCVVALRR